MNNTNDNPHSPYVVKVDPIVAPLVPDYLKNRATDLQRLTEALAARDFAVLRKVGHNIRGSAGAYGLPPLSAIGARIEDAAQAQDAAPIGPALDDMRLFLQNVKFVP
jgi:HPt (histidine-containing phosphotransfer) domain-containing protein